MSDSDVSSFNSTLLQAAQAAGLNAAATVSQKSSNYSTLFYGTTGAGGLGAAVVAVANATTNACSKQSFTIAFGGV